MASSVYVETSVISYYTARPSRDIVTAARQTLTQEWWEDARQRFDLYVSVLLDTYPYRPKPLVAVSTALNILV